MDTGSDTMTLWPFLTSDRKSLYYCRGSGMSRRPEIVVATREREAAPFRNPVPVRVGQQQVFGRSPRYVKATGELFFSAVPDSESHDWDLWVIRNHAPPSGSAPLAGDQRSVTD